MKDMEAMSSLMHSRLSVVLVSHCVGFNWVLRLLEIFNGEMWHSGKRTSWSLHELEFAAPLERAEATRMSQTVHESIRLDWFAHDPRLS